MEDYFDQPREALERDMRPEFGYQGQSLSFIFAGSRWSDLRSSRANSGEHGEAEMHSRYGVQGDY
jgi:hypothetical protein